MTTTTTTNLDLDVYTPKYTVTLFSPSTHKYNYHPQVSIGSDLIALQKTWRILGVIFDPLFTFSPHTRTVAKAATKRLKLFNALAETSWDQDVDTRILTYTALRSEIDFAAPI